MEKIILILSAIAVLFIIRYFYKKTRSITCERCGRITNLLHSRIYNGAHICDECFKQQTSNNNTYNTDNTDKTYTADNIYTTDKTTDKDRFSNINNTFYSKNISKNDNNITVSIKTNQTFLDDKFNPFDDKFPSFKNNTNSFDKDKNVKPFKPTYEIEHFIAVNEDDKTWSLYPFREVYKYSDITDYSVKETTTDMEIPEINIQDDMFKMLIDTLRDNNIKLDIDQKNNNSDKPLKKLILTVRLKNSNSLSVSYATEIENDEALDGKKEKITALLEDIKNNA